MIYSGFCKDQLGAYPEELRINLFRERKQDERKFTQAGYTEALKWAESVVERMKSRDFIDWFETRPEYFRCTNLCSARAACKFGRPENHRKDDNNDAKPAAA